MKLIDADKLLEWLSDKTSHLGSDERMIAFEEVQESVESGDFDPDTNPTGVTLPDHIMDMLKQNSRYKLTYGYKKYLIRQVITSIEKL